MRPSPAPGYAPLQLPDLEALERAAEIVYDVCLRTPLVRARDASGDATRAEIWLKPETLQPIGSFKLRGIYHAVSRLGASRRDVGLLTVSAGNTAQALAWCGRRFGVAATSLMPEGAPATKVAAVEALGGTVRQVPRDALFEFLREGGWRSESAAFVHPWIEPDVIAGHASLGLELVRELEHRDPSRHEGSHGRPPARRDGKPVEIYVSVGGGGLIAGIGSALHAAGWGERTRLVAVEPSGCPALHASLAAGEPVSVDCRTFCDGVAVPYITREMFPLLRRVVDRVDLVEESTTRRALAALARGNRLTVEGSAALTYAAALASDGDASKICVLSGGSLDEQVLLSILADTAAGR